jgi:predicted nucleotidyltransferase
MKSLLESVRLEDFQLQAIINAFNSYFLPDDHLWIFGSRAELHKKGGDIDLYIETKSADAKEAYERETKFISEIWDRIGEQKIDIVMNLVSLEGGQLPIYEVARTKGIKLI